MLLRLAYLGIANAFAMLRLLPMSDFTPTGSSWLNLVERWFAELTNKQIRRGVHRSVQALEKTSGPGSPHGTLTPRPYVWTKTADEILERLASYLNRIPDSED